MDGLFGCPVDSGLKPRLHYKVTEKESTPPFDWEAWYEACGGRVDHTPGASKIIAEIYNTQSLAFEGPAAEKKIPFKTEQQAADFVKAAARTAGAAAVGITRIEPSDIYQGRTVSETYAIAIGQRMQWKQFQTVPSIDSGVECCRVYHDLGEICIRIAKALRDRGFPARVEDPVGDSDLMHVPIALRAGFGELGRHGSIIHPELGPLFRLGTVVTDLPMACDAPIDVGIAAFCDRCKACRKLCPADAIPDDRDPESGMDPIGKPRYVLDTGRCFPYFARQHYCSICLAVCAYRHKEWAKDFNGAQTTLSPNTVLAEPPPTVDPNPPAKVHDYPRIKVLYNRTHPDRKEGV